MSWDRVKKVGHFLTLFEIVTLWAAWNGAGEALLRMEATA